MKNLKLNQFIHWQNQTWIMMWWNTWWHSSPIIFSNWITPQKFAIVTNENPEVLKLLKFYLEYVAANYACKDLSYQSYYTFFYHIFNQLNHPKKKGCWAAGKTGEIIESITENFQYFSGAGHWSFNRNLFKQKIIYCGLPSILVSDWGE